MVVSPQANKPMFITQSIMSLENNMPLKYIKLLFWYSRIETDTSVASLDLEEDIVLQIPEKWWLNGRKRSSET